MGTNSTWSKSAAPLHIVHLEDDPNDAALVRAVLEESGVPFEIAPASDRDGFVAALTTGRVDLVLSDYALPQFDGLSALALARELAPDVPFILISGTMGEDAAIDSLRSGATDYVLKHRMSRLAPAVQRALKEASELAARRATEEALEHERQFLRAVLDSLASGVVACDRAGVPTLFNPPLRSILGLPEGAISPEDWLASYQLYLPDRRTPVDSEPLERALRGERLRNVELTVLQRSGVERAVLASGQPIFDAQGTEIGAVVALQDITERKQLEEQFRQAQKMEAMGRLAAGVAHDFNNLLTVITGHSELLRRRLSDDGAAPHDLEAIEKASQRATGLTRQLLAFSRQQILEPRVLDLNSVIAEMKKMLERVIGADIDLAFQPARDLDKVRADAGQIEQILMNLIVNARDAMPSGGAITIVTKRVEVSDLAGRGGPVAGAVAPCGGPDAPIPPGRYALVSVTDTGCGMDSETRAHIFEPFFTTKGVGQGTGLGLSTVHGIVTQSGGHVAVDSEPGRGTTFGIYLPATSGSEEAGRPAPKDARGSRGAERILVVDDDDALRALVVEVLELSGYRVSEAASGEAALDLIERGRLEVDVVITDVVMPRLGGRELVHRLATVRPSLRTLYISGYVERDAGTFAVDLPAGVGFLQKPFTPETLLQRLRGVLDAPMTGGVAKGARP